MAAVGTDRHAALQDAASRHLLLHFTRNGDAFRGEDDLLMLERGEGPHVFDTEGRRYIDALSSLFCSQIGYSYGEEMAAAVADQLGALAFNTNWGTAHPPAVELAERLAGLAPGDLNRVFFTSGGSESVEAAWKIAREHFIAAGEPQRTRAIARSVAYHGVTLGALSFTGVDGMKQGFGAPPIDVSRVAWTNAFRDGAGLGAEEYTDRLLAELRGVVEEIGEELAMIIVEPVQNAGGCLTAPEGYWSGLREIADESGALLVADEVICGFGRLGHWLGTETEGVVPDIATFAKGLTSAYAPMGAVMVTDRVAEPLLEPGRMLRHGITFGGHPVCAAVALRNIEIIERDGILENVRGLEPHLAQRMEGLRSLPIVGDVRGRGFFWAVELVKDSRATRFDADERESLLRGHLPRLLRDYGLIARADDRGDSVLQIAPPLICDRETLEEIVDRLGAVLVGAGEQMGIA